MFDRLIESDTAGAEFKSRRRYFLVSTVVVGALFVSAVVFSIYASEVGLGNDTYELTALLTPVQPAAEAPEPPQPQQRSQALDHTTQTPTRVVRQQPIEASPVDVPLVSAIPNKYLSLPSGLSQIGPRDTDPPPSFNDTVGRPGTGSSGSTPVQTNENNVES